MEKILFAINIRQAEEFIEASLTKKYPSKYAFVGSVLHKDNLIEKMRATTPDIVIVREGLPGPTNLFELVVKAKLSFPSTRFIFIAGPRKPGDAFMQKLFGYQIYDIIAGSKLNVALILDMIVNPTSFKEASIWAAPPELRAEGFDVDVEDEEPRESGEEIIDIIGIEDKKAPTPTPTSKKQPGKGTGTIVLPIGKNNKSNPVDEDMLAQMAEMQAEIDRLKKENKSKKAPTPLTNKVSSMAPKAPSQKKPIIGIKDNSQALKSQYLGKDKIVTFFGAKNGIGTTTIAYNVAMELAYRKRNVLYIEVNDFNPMIPYWYDVYQNLGLNNGIDKAVLGFETGINKDIDEALITREELIRNSPDSMAENFKLFPKTLDYLFFSEEYIESRNKQIISSNSFSQILLYFMQQLNYNYLILDINTHTDQSIIETALTFSNMNYIVVSQEFSSIGYYQTFFNKLKQKGMDFSKKDDGKKDLSDKNSVIINRYIPKAEFNQRQIKEWLEEPDIFIVPDNSKDIADLSFNGLPIMKNTKNKDFAIGIASIANDIES